MRQLVISFIFIILLAAAFIAATGCHKEEYPIQGTFRVSDGTEEFYLLFKEYDLIESFNGHISQGTWSKSKDTVVTCNPRGYHSWVAEKTYGGWVFTQDTLVWILTSI